MRSGRAEAGQAKEASGGLETGLSRRAAPISPDSLRWLYKTSEYVPAAMGRNALGIAGFGDQYPNPGDQFRFLAHYRREAETATYAVLKVNNGGYDESDPGLEANSDIQYSSLMAYPTPHIFFSGRTPPWAEDGGPQMRRG
jgi:tripeptidyl-peptidase-1